jgi:hypothetical protein
MGAPDSPVRHRCANGRLQWLVLTASRWADGTPDSEQSLSGAHRTVNSHCPVHTGQSGALSGAPLKFISGTGALGFLRGKTLPQGHLGPTWQRVHRTVRCTSDSPVPQGQKPYFLFSAVFQIGFRSNLWVSSRVTPSTICECECAPTLH